MATARKTPVDTFRKRLRQKGMVRVEVHVLKDDAVLVKSVARALGNPKMAAEARTILKARFTKPAQAGLKALLASAPLEGVDLERPRDLGVLILGEIRKGLELIRARDPQQAQALETWLDAITEAFGERALPIETAIADEWGCLNAIRPVPVIDGLLAATAKVHGLTLVTRNEADVAGLGAAVLNPFT